MRGAKLRAPPDILTGRGLLSETRSGSRIFVRVFELVRSLGDEALNVPNKR